MSQTYYRNYRESMKYYCRARDVYKRFFTEQHPKLRSVMAYIQQLAGTIAYEDYHHHT